MSEPIIFVDSSRIREGKLEEFKQATKELVELIDANEPQLIAYGIYISDDGKQMTGFQIHPDSASIETHFAVAGPHFRKIMELIDQGEMNVFGRPSDGVVQQMKGMASSMGMTLTFKDLHAGFTRLQR